MIYSLSKYSGSMNDYAEEEVKKGNLDSFTTFKINLISGSISWIIVLFNKFIIGKVSYS